MKYVGLAFSLSMLSEEYTHELRTYQVTPEDFKQAVSYPDIVSCCNPSHKATLQALKEKFGIDVPVPATPPRVTMKAGDCLYVFQVSGLPRLTDRHEYNSEEIAKAKFSFMSVAVEA